MKQAVGEMRGVLRSPIAAMCLISDIKHPERASRFLFVGYLRYMFSYSQPYKETLFNWLNVNLLVDRKAREEDVYKVVREMLRVGLVSEREYRGLLMTLYTINRVIKRYRLIYFLWR